MNRAIKTKLKKYGIATAVILMALGFLKIGYDLIPSRLYQDYISATQHKTIPTVTGSEFSW